MTFHEAVSRTSTARPARSKLPRRLDALLQLAGEVECLADVGTDHALLPAHAVLRGVCKRAIAVDILELPLVGARATLAQLGVSDRVTVLHDDGLKALTSREVDVVVLAGLTGRTMLSLCQAAPEALRRVQRLIVQPNGHLAELRAWAHAAGLWLVDENICPQRGRFFVSCAFEWATGADPAYEDSELTREQAFELGPWLVRRRDPVALAHYARELARFQVLIDAGRGEHAAAHALYATGVRLLAP